MFSMALTSHGLLLKSSLLQRKHHNTTLQNGFLGYRVSFIFKPHPKIGPPKTQIIWKMPPDLSEWFHNPADRWHYQHFSKLCHISTLLLTSFLSIVYWGVIAG